MKYKDFICVFLFRMSFVIIVNPYPSEASRTRDPLDQGEENASEFSGLRGYITIDEQQAIHSLLYYEEGGNPLDQDLLKPLSSHHQSGSISEALSQGVYAEEQEENASDLLVQGTHFFKKNLIQKLLNVSKKRHTINLTHL